MAGSGRWQVLVPVKRLADAKSRLSAALGEHRLDVVRAFVLDTLAAARGCPDVDVRVVTPDAEAGALASEAGVDVLDDGGSGDLNAALRVVLPRLPADARVAVVPADLPALTSTDLRLALSRAEPHETAFVMDAAGRGTTLLAAARPGSLVVAFGPHSAAAHEASGARRLDPAGLDRLRTDVDTPADLALAVRLGVGSATRAALWRCGMI